MGRWTGTVVAQWKAKLPAKAKRPAPNLARQIDLTLSSDHNWTSYSKMANGGHHSDSGTWDLAGNTFSLTTSTHKVLTGTLSENGKKIVIVLRNDPHLTGTATFLRASGS